MTAARKTEKWPALAEYLKLLYAEPVANDGRGEDEKDKEKMNRAADLAEVLGKLGKWQEALPHFQEAAELARADYPEQKQNFAHAALHLADYATALHQMQVAIQVGMTKDKAGELLDQWAKDMPEKAAEIVKIREKVAGKPAAPTAAEPKAP